MQDESTPDRSAESAEQAELRRQEPDFAGEHEAVTTEPGSDDADEQESPSGIGGMDADSGHAV
jgi:hypothetical protein